MPLAAVPLWAPPGALLVVLLAAAVVYGVIYDRRATRRWPADGRIVATAAGPLHVVEAGRGPAVVLVHGASANNRELRSTLEAPLVEAGFRVLALDRPGFGGSPGRAGGGRLEGHARAVAALIEAEGLVQPIVIGHSYGGAIALRLALDRPGLAGGYVLVGPATHGDVGPVAWYNHAGAAPVLGWLFASAVAPVAGPIFAPGGLGSTFAPAAAPAGHADATGVGLLFRPSSFAANAADLHCANRELRAQQSRYHEVVEPVALIAGEADRTVLTARHAERTAVALPRARLALLPEVGHMPHHAAPDLVVEHVRALHAEIVAAAESTP